ncbi:MAG: hypothetical protein WAW06_04035 [bacterium]
MTMRKGLLLCLAAACFAALQGCEEEDIVRYDQNLEPETILTVAPGIDDAIFHKYHVHWAGLDRDGVVVAYEIASLPEDHIYGGMVIGIVDSVARRDLIEDYFLEQEELAESESLEFWTRTAATDSVFIFRADKPNSRKHSLYIRAIDNEGKPDPLPAATNFMAVDYGIPQVTVFLATSIDTVPRVPPAKGDTIPAINLGSADPKEPIVITLSWQGGDSDGEITQWVYRLDASSEVEIGPEVRSISKIYWPDSLEASDVWIGSHEFRLTGVDDAGARGDFRVAKFVINYDPNTYIDEVWTFRDPASHQPVPERRIYPGDSTRVAYHFGRLRFYFDGSDLDGAPPDSFRWNIKGTLIQSVNPADATSPWVGVRDPGDTNRFYAETPSGTPYLDTDSPLTIFVRAKDELGKVDGSPDTVSFIVNYTPVITPGSLAHQDLGGGTVKFTWNAYDPDEDVTRGTGGDMALMQYRYRIDDGDWVRVTTKERVGSFYVFVKQAEVTGIPPGSHVFTLQAFNGDYLLTRSDTETLSFTLDY